MDLFLKSIGLRGLPEGANKGEACGSPTPPPGQSPLNSLCVHSFIHSFIYSLADPSLTASIRWDDPAPGQVIKDCSISSGLSRNIPVPVLALPLAPHVTLGKSLTTLNLSFPIPTMGMTVAAPSLATVKGMR